MTELEIARLNLQKIINREYELYQPTEEEWKLIEDDARKYLKSLEGAANK